MSDDDQAPAIGLPSLTDVTRWGLGLTDEVMRLPTTVARARKVVAVLPSQLDELLGRLEALQGSIDGLATQLSTTTTGIDDAMPMLADAVVRLEQRLEGMDHLLGELGGTVVGTINAVPGLRRIQGRGRGSNT